MQIRNSIIVVTGGANGIGRALCQRFHQEGAAGIVVADLDGQKATDLAVTLGPNSIGVACDVSDGEAITRLVRLTEERYGRIDLFCSNAGIGSADPDPSDATSADATTWDRCWRVNVMAHVHAARAALPGMQARGEGWFLQTVSAAGLLVQIGSASYTATKHAALGFAQSLAITHRDRGIGVSVLCPQAVATAMLPAGNAPLLDNVLTPADVADCTVQGLSEGRFMILPHPQVATYVQQRAADTDRWVGGMVKLRRRLLTQAT